MSRLFQLVLAGHLPHLGWKFQLLAILLLSLAFSCLLGLFLRRNHLRAVLWQSLVLSTLLLLISVSHASKIAFLTHSAMNVSLFAQQQIYSAPNLADPLDSSYRPGINRNSADYPDNVWATDSLQKVRQDSGAPGPAHWAILSAAKNEFADFQVHVQAGTNPITLSVTASDLVNNRTGTRISHLTNIVIYREAYLNITTRSNANGSLGPTPDILIPAIDPYYHQPRNAFPYIVEPHKNQSAWIDVLIPSGAPAGYYSGEITVSDGGKPMAILPVLLSVWNFALPSTATLKTAFRLTGYGLCAQAYGSESNCGAYPGSQGKWASGVDLSHVDQAVMFLDHRVSLSNVVFSTPYDDHWTAFNKLYGPLLNGTPANTKSMLAGAQLTTVEFNGGSNATGQQWASNFQAQGWSPRLYDYTCDEPPENCNWADIRSKAAAAHSVVPPMRSLVTTSIRRATAQDVLPSIDILSPVVDQMDGLSGTNQRAAYNSWLAGPGHHLWWYQSCDEASTCDNGKPGGADQTYGNYMIDSSAVRNRVFQWMAYLYGIETELYYFTDYCWSTACGYPITSSDPWKSVYIFGGNGDGTLEYPGIPSKIGGTVPIPLPSIRLNHIRDGMQDYEYLAALDRAGYAKFATAKANSFITNPYTFSNHSEDMLVARGILGSRLHQLAMRTATGQSPLQTQATSR